MKDRLRNLIDGFRELDMPDDGRSWTEHLADHLLEGGVIVPPCKVGDKTHLLLERVRGGYGILESKCVGISENKSGKWYSMYFDSVAIGNSLEYREEDFGKIVFLTREEAEKALAERSNEDAE